MSKDFRSSEDWSRREVDALVSRAVAIRKALSDAQGRGLVQRSVISDAVQIANWIETLGSYFGRCAAEEKIIVFDQLLALANQLESEC